MPKLSPIAYLRQCEARENENKRKLRVASQIMEKAQHTPRKSGRKTKKEREVEERMKDQAAFLLFLEKEKETKSEPPETEE